MKELKYFIGSNDNLSIIKFLCQEEIPICDVANMLNSIIQFRCAFMEHNKEVVRENTSFIDKWLSGSMTKDGSIDLDIVKQLNDRILSLFKKGVEE